MYDIIIGEMKMELREGYPVYDAEENVGKWKIKAFMAECFCVRFAFLHLMFYLCKE